MPGPVIRNNDLRCGLWSSRSYDLFIIGSAAVYLSVTIITGLPSSLDQVFAVKALVGGVCRHTLGGNRPVMVYAYDSTAGGAYLAFSLVHISKRCFQDPKHIKTKLIMSFCVAQQGGQSHDNCKT